MGLDLLLMPSRSLHRRHARWLVLAVGGFFLLAGLRMLALGAWPMLPFMLADVALMVWAFRASYLSGRAREHVVLADDELRLTRISHHGRRSEVRLPAFFTRVQLEETPLGDTRLWLASKGRRVAVGGFLPPPERREIGALIEQALARHRNARWPGDHSPSTSAMA